ncbi:MAG: DnaD domain protein, partial [Clostridia bacterium]|nr:DnaD domain protein [Clostridia bacterium]
MKYGMIYGPSAVVLPDKVLRERLAEMNGTELKLLVYVCLSGGECDTASACAALGITPSEADDAALKLSGWGLLSADGKSSDGRTKKKTPVPKDLPHYSGEEIGRIIEQNGLRTLMDECQRILGTMFSTAEINKIIALFDYLKLDEEYLLILVTHCSKIGKRSIAYISKMAYTLFDEGIDTPHKLEYRLKASERVYDMEPRLRKLFGYGDRAWTPREKDYLRQWIGEWDFSFEVIEKAFFITVDKTGKTSLAYMNKVLSNWHDSGYKTL